GLLRVLLLSVRRPPGCALFPYTTLFRSERVRRTQTPVFVDRDPRMRVARGERRRHRVRPARDARGVEEVDLVAVRRLQLRDGVAIGVPRGGRPRADRRRMRPAPGDNDEV